MFTGVQFTHFIQANPALAVFLTVALGFLLGKLRIRSFSLGTVTSVLLVGVVVGQLRIEIPEPAKTLFFLMFLFAVGYAVGPQFFRGLKKDGLPQVAFAVVVCLLCLGSVWLFSWLMGYTLSQAAGLLAGSQTMSAVLGVATDTIRELPGGAETDLSSMPVCYAVTYIFGTAGSAWVLSSIGPRLLGGVAKVKQSARDLEQKMGEDLSLKAGFDPAAREIVFRVFSADNEWFEGGRTVHEFETVMQRDGKRIFVERLCQQGKIVDEVTPRTVIRPGDQLVVSGRREYVISEEKWIGAEVSDTTLTNFAVQVLPVVVNRKGAAGERIGKVLSAKFMHGVNIRSIVRAGVKIPVRSGAKLDAGDRIIISASAIPGNEKSISNIINELYRKGADVVYEKSEGLHVSGHACQEELKIVHGLVKPKFFIPVHGEQRHLQLHAKLAQSMGMNPRNIHIGEIGTVFEFTGKTCKVNGTVPAGRVFVDGSGVGDVGSVVLRDRKHLAEDGMIVVCVNLSSEDGSIITGPDIITRGFIYVKESEELMDELKEVAMEAIDRCQRKRVRDWSAIKSAIKNDLSGYLYKTTKRNPMILPVIMEI